MMRRLKRFCRLIQINLMVARNGLDEILLAIPLFAPLRFLMYFNPWYWRNRRRGYGERLRLTLESLGPIFVKFGQMLSTRRDLIPDDIADELKFLQDNVPPFPSAQAMAILKQQYTEPLDHIFTFFDPQPLASASIAQVHRAVLRDGPEVVVKILRPGIKKVIQHDIDILYTIAELAERHWPQLHRFHPVDIVAEFEHSLLNELDLMHEAANASQLRRNFAHDPDLYIPKVHWPYARSKVLVLERIHGVPVADVATLRAAGVDLKRLAEMGVNIFFTQVFRDCFFHADMHPGNIFVDISKPEQAHYIAVDFGIVGTLNRSDQRYLAENFLAFFNRDYYLVAQLHIDSGWVPRETRVEQLESAIRTVCEPMFERPLKELSVGIILLRLFQTARQFNMEIQPQLVLLQKTLLNIEGLGRQLYPDLDLWSTAKPFLERWLKEQVGPRGMLRKIRQQAPFWMEKWPDMPGLLYDVLQQTRETQQKQLGDFNQRPAVPPKAVHRRGLVKGTGLSLIVAGMWCLLGIDGTHYPAGVGAGFIGLGAVMAWWGSGRR